MTVIISGDKKLTAQIKRLKQPENTFDRDIKFVARQNLRQLIKDNPKETGDTARAWTKVTKISKAVYRVSNNKRTEGEKRSLVEILDKGRGVVRPKKPGGSLYIPLSQIGKTKKLGAKIPPSFKYGKDYVLAKKAKAYKGTKFLQEAIRDAKKLMVKRLSFSIGRL